MKRWIRFESVSVLIILLWLLGHLSILGWPSDLASHFQLQYAVAALGCLLVALRRQEWMYAVPLLVVLIVSTFGIVPYWPRFGPTTGALAKPHLRLMQVNVLYQNQAHRRVEQAIVKYDPDILSLQEVDPRWIQALQPVLKKYPYHLEHVVWKRSCGLALYSKRPLHNRRLRDYGNVGRVVLSADLQLGQRTITVASMHPHSPGWITRYENRERQFLTFARERHQLNPYLILLGDLNNTPFSTSFKTFLGLTGLKDTRIGYGLYPTWPSILPILWVPIDHVLVSPQFEAQSFQTGPYTGSDHFPLIADIALKDEPTLKKE